jgi:hypothetical protein
MIEPFEPFINKYRITANNEWLKAGISRLPVWGLVLGKVARRGCLEM